MNEYDDDFELDRDVKLKDFRPMDREVYLEDIYDAYDGDINEYKKSIEIEKAKEEAERKRAYEQVQKKEELQNNLIMAFVYSIPVIFVLMCFIIDASSGFYLFIKFIFAINGGYCLLKIVDHRGLNAIKKIAYIGLVIIGLIGISGIVGARYDEDFWLFIDALYCILKALSFLSGLANNV